MVLRDGSATVLRFLILILVTRHLTTHLHERQDVVPYIDWLPSNCIHIVYILQKFYFSLIWLPEKGDDLCRIIVKEECFTFVRLEI